jgi:ATP-dependent Lon protease
VPKITPASLATGVGFVTDYFGEVLVKLREESFADRVRDVPLQGGLTRRDQTAIERLTSGMIKLLYPDGKLTPDELLEVVTFACEFRQRVHNQLVAIAPGEFKAKLIGPQSLNVHAAPDLHARAVDTSKDRLNTEAVVGATTGLAVLSSGDREFGGDTILIQVSAFNGSPGIEVTGMHGATLKDSIKAVYTLIRSNFRDFGVPEQRLKTQTVAVHLVKIAEPKDGPSAGLAFLVGMVSALANKPVKPAFAFTGEVAIHGEVGAVGGIPQKLNAALRAGRKFVVVPGANAGDVPADVKNSLTVYPVASAKEAIKLAFGE